MDFYTWTHQYWPNRKSLYSSTLCRCHLEYLSIAMTDWDGWREKVLGIRAVGIPCWWWWNMRFTPNDIFYSCLREIYILVQMALIQISNDLFLLPSPLSLSLSLHLLIPSWELFCSPFRPRLNWHKAVLKKFYILKKLLSKFSLHWVEKIAYLKSNWCYLFILFFIRRIVNHYYLIGFIFSFIV